MTEQPPSLADLLDRLQFLLQEPLDVTQTDPETTKKVVRLLTAAAHYFNLLAVADFGGRAGTPRGAGLGLVREQSSQTGGGGVDWLV